MFKQWEGFKEGVWQNGIDVRNSYKRTILHMKETRVS